ncbi:MAG: hypothetical protein IIA45_02065 [Bacteroidetes bacterium]|nr:hypothetical protein [Bacteroidota bacterium]
MKKVIALSIVFIAVFTLSGSAQIWYDMMMGENPNLPLRSQGTTKLYQD